MSDLPSVDNYSLRVLEEEIMNLRRGGSKEDPRPHKLLMLLAVIDQLDEGAINSNRIPFEDTLIRSFERNFRHYSSLNDWCQPGPPYFHLRSSTFWHHRVKPSREEAYAKLTTSGGGKKRILDNIDYAYFSDEAWNVFSDAASRGHLRVFLTRILDSEFPAWNLKHSMKAETSNAPKKNRLTNVAFHDSFPLSRLMMAQVLREFANVPNTVDLSPGPKRKVLLRETTQLGTRQVLSVSDYAFGGGLLDSRYHLSRFGHQVLARDPLLETDANQWLVHYHLSAPHGPGHLFWHRLVTRFFRIGDEFSSDEVMAEISSVMRELKGKEIATSTIESTKTAFLSSYLNPDGLARLGVLQPTDQNGYLVQEPDPPSPWVFGLALLDYWRATYGENRLTINLDDLSAPGALGDIFLIGGGRINRYLQQLADEGYVEVYRYAPPYQVVLRHSDPAPLLEKLYAPDSHDS